MNNPFKFGTIVDGEYFTDRVAEQEKVREILASENHLILISHDVSARPASFKSNERIVTSRFSVEPAVGNRHCRLAARLLWIMLQQYPMERLKHLITHFRFIPTIQPIP